VSSSSRRKSELSWSCFLAFFSLSLCWCCISFRSGSLFFIRIRFLDIQSWKPERKKASERKRGLDATFFSVRKQLAFYQRGVYVCLLREVYSKDISSRERAADEFKASRVDAPSFPSPRPQENRSRTLALKCRDPITCRHNSSFGWVYVLPLLSFSSRVLFSFFFLSHEISALLSSFCPTTSTPSPKARPRSPSPPPSLDIWIAFVRNKSTLL